MSQNMLNNAHLGKGSMTSFQRSQFADLAACIRQRTARNSWLEHNRIAFETLIYGGLPQAEALHIVARSVWALRAMGAKQFTNLPYYPRMRVPGTVR